MPVLTRYPFRLWAAICAGVFIPLIPSAHPRQAHIQPIRDSRRYLPLARLLRHAPGISRDCTDCARMRRLHLPTFPALDLPGRAVLTRAIEHASSNPSTSFPIFLTSALPTPTIPLLLQPRPVSPVKGESSSPPVPISPWPCAPPALCAAYAVTRAHRTRGWIPPGGRLVYRRLAPF